MQSYKRFAQLCLHRILLYFPNKQSTMNLAEFDEIKPHRAMFVLLHSLGLGIR